MAIVTSPGPHPDPPGLSLYSQMSPLPGNSQFSAWPLHVLAALPCALTVDSASPPGSQPRDLSLSLHSQTQFYHNLTPRCGVESAGPGLVSTARRQPHAWLSSLASHMCTLLESEVEVSPILCVPQWIFQQVRCLSLLCRTPELGCADCDSTYLLPRARVHTCRLLFLTHPSQGHRS